METTFIAFFMITASQVWKVRSFTKHARTVQLHDAWGGRTGVVVTRAAPFEQRFRGGGHRLQFHPLRIHEAPMAMTPHERA
ncbi:hypothetical protein [Ramlibacter pallidus]|uniref:Secreted protein n=1 Tax=Ramlibacter pallidus TaxID=2780087 RepID=A0ABR9S5Y5_9BURK|nr:hypothetical protein [Ramlibacter pallidus]MBE7368898.1 hypothetical protein [Ramlibacter pallidus]